MKDLNDLPGRAREQDQSEEVIAADYNSVAVSDSQMQEELQLIQTQLPRVLAAWNEPEELFSGVAKFGRVASGRGQCSAFFNPHPGLRPDLSQSWETTLASRRCQPAGEVRTDRNFS